MNRLNQCAPELNASLPPAVVLGRTEGGRSGRGSRNDGSLVSMVMHSRRLLLDAPNTTGGPAPTKSLVGYAACGIGGKKNKLLEQRRNVLNLLSKMNLDNNNNDGNSNGNDDSTTTATAAMLLATTTSATGENTATASSHGNIVNNTAPVEALHPAAAQHAGGKRPFLSTNARVTNDNNNNNDTTMSAAGGASQYQYHHHHHYCHRHGNNNNNAGQQHRRYKRRHSVTRYSLECAANVFVQEQQREQHHHQQQQEQQQEQHNANGNGRGMVFGHGGMNALVGTSSILRAAAAATSLTPIYEQQEHHRHHQQQLHNPSADAGTVRFDDDECYAPCAVEPPCKKTRVVAAGAVEHN